MNPMESNGRYRERIWESHLAADFERDVLAGLRAPQKAISSKYLYDALGSALFEAIVLLPEYDLPRRERALLKQHATRIVEKIGKPPHLLELGGGSSEKTRMLLEAAIAQFGSVRYTTIDISLEAVRTAAAQLLDTYPQITVDALVGGYFQVLADVEPRSATLALFLGSNLGNYPGRRGSDLFAAIHAALSPGDMFLLGVDLRKERAAMELAYNDALGVTAAFSKNVLARINRELGAEIELANFCYASSFDEATGSIEAYLIAERSATYALGAGHESIDVAAGERVHIESSHKFTREEVRAIGEECGFMEREFLTDDDNAFALILLERSQR